MSTHRCLRCNGTKKYAPLGGIYKTCDFCKGVGHVIAPETKSATIEPPINPQAGELPSVKKKPGRKKGWNKPTVQAPAENAIL